VFIIRRRDFHGEVINCRPRKTRKKYNKKQIQKRLEKKKIDILVKQFESENNTQTVIVKKVSFLAKVIEIFVDTFFKMVHLLFWVGICVLISIGLNTLLNNQLRMQIIEMFHKLIGG
jgi:hypothetical protein